MRPSLGPVNFVEPQNAVVIPAHFAPDDPSDHADRCMPANFMVFTNREVQKKGNHGTAYKAVAHVSRNRGKPMTLLGVCSDTATSVDPRNRFGVTIKGAVTVACNREDVKDIHPGDKVYYQHIPTALTFSGLPADFRTASLTGSLSGLVTPFVPHINQHTFVEHIRSNSANPEQLARTIWDTLNASSNGGDMGNFDNLYTVGANTLMRTKPDDPMDYIRDMLGTVFTDFDHPSEFDTFWHHHILSDDPDASHGGSAYIATAGTGLDYKYRGWLLDLFAPDVTPVYQVEDIVVNKAKSAVMVGYDRNAKDATNDIPSETFAGTEAPKNSNWKHWKNFFEKMKPAKSPRFIRFNSGDKNVKYTFADNGATNAALTEALSAVFGTTNLGGSALARIFESVTKAESGLLGTLVEKNADSDEIVVELAGPDL